LNALTSPALPSLKW